MSFLRLSLISLAAATLASCFHVNWLEAPPPEPSARNVFLKGIETLCGNAYSGMLVEGDSSDEVFTRVPVVMHVRSCTDSAIRIPLHVGGDHSRVWIFTKTRDGLRLKHEHTHADGTRDILTNYGGDSLEGGTGTTQTFGVDDETHRLFVANGLKPSVQNEWTVEIHPGEMFAYQLERPGRLFRLEFDLTKPLASAPEPWAALTPSSE